MKILYILKHKSPDTTVSNLIKEHKKTHEVTIINLTEENTCDQIVDLIMSNDRVISW